MAHNGLIIVKKARGGLTSKQGVLVNGDVAFSKLGMMLSVINGSLTIYGCLGQGWMPVLSTGWLGALLACAAAILG